MRAISIIVAAVMFGAVVAEAADIDPAKAVQFPVVLDSASKTGADSLKSGDVFYEQALRSAKAVRLKSDLSLVYKTRNRLLGGFAPASDNPLTIKAGQIFVVARRGGVEVYCTTVSDRTDDSLGRVYEIAVCLRDDNDDGVFDASVNFESYPYRVRVPYEIAAIWKDDWQAVSAAYEVVEQADIPQFRLTFRYQIFKKRSESVIYSLLSNEQEAHLYTSICWPQVMLAQTAGAGGECGVMDWFALKDAISADPNAKGTLSEQGMNVVWQRNPDSTLKAEVTTPLPGGPALLSTGAWVVMGTELRQGTLVVQIAPQP